MIELRRRLTCVGAAVLMLGLAAQSPLRPNSLRRCALLKHARNFGTPSDEIGELSGLLQSATMLAVDLHINWDERDPQLWELEFIKNKGAVAGNGSLVLSMLSDAADLHRKSIVGFAQNMSDCRVPPHEKLLSWYERHGFARICVEEHGVQVRRRWRHGSAGR